MPRGLTGSMAVTRVSISRAALLVKVTARTPAGATRPPLISQAMRVVSTRVLPLPAPARMSACSSGRVTAASCSGLRCSRCSDTRGEFYRPARALSGNDARIFDAVLALELVGQHLRVGLRRQAADAHAVRALLVRRRRLELRAVAGGAHLLVHLQDLVHVRARGEHHLPLA